MPIERVWLAHNGAVIVFDTHGQQVPDWQTNLFCEHLRKMFEAGVITLSTQIETFGGSNRITTVRDWLGDYPHIPDP